MFERLKGLVVLRRVDRNVERLCIAVERVASALEQQRESPGTMTFRSHYNDPNGVASVISTPDELLAMIVDRETKLGRALDEDELADFFASGGAE
jgi:hypothetical protein